MKFVREGNKFKKTILEEFDISDCGGPEILDRAVESYCRMREGEILNMKKSWIDLKESLIVVPRQAQKRKRKDKRVPINSAIRSILERLLKKDSDSEYLFVNPQTKTRYTKI